MSVSMDHPDDPVPKYTPADTGQDHINCADSVYSADGSDIDDDFYARVARAKSLPLPIRAAPRRIASHIVLGQDDDDDGSIPREHRFLAINIVESFFSSVGASRDELVRDFVARGLVSPDVKSSSGETPLLAAVRARNMSMMRTLLSLGALVNQFGSSTDHPQNLNPFDYHQQIEYLQRTPLQLAAQTGYLAGVKCLMEDHGADDALVAPDGAIALRLAAENGHGEIVAYLPQRRAGALLRWKTAHRREMRVIRQALKKMGKFVLFFVYSVPEFFLYRVPKGLWQRRQKIAKWVTKLPRRVGREVLQMSKDIWSMLKRAPEYLERLRKAVLRFFLKDVPAAARIVGGYIHRCAAKVGGVAWRVVKSIVSLLHTAVVAIIDFFKNVTVADIRDGLVYVLRGLFVDLPKALFSFVKGFGDMSYDVLKTLAGFLGKVVWWLGGMVVWLFTYLPVKIWQCIEAMGRLAGRGANECLVFFNPKRM